MTSWPVASAILSAVSREIQALSSLHRAVTLAGDNPTCRANALRLVPVLESHSASFMAGA
ncbi:hypothetical protein [Xanthobacter sediminis]